MKDTVLEFRALFVNAGARVLVERINLTVPSGQICIFEGPSGCGKTSLLHVVMGFAAPAAGEVLLWGTRLDDFSAWRLRQRMAYVPQEPDMGEGTVEEVLKRPLGYRASKHIRWDAGQVNDILSSLLLSPSVLEQNIRKLSGGERQRLAITSALLLRRDLLVLDEPTSALDAASRRAVVEVLKGLNDTTVIIAAHDELLMEAANISVDISKQGADAVHH